MARTSPRKTDEEKLLEKIRAANPNSTEAEIRNIAAPIIKGLSEGAGAIGTLLALPYSIFSKKNMEDIPVTGAAIQQFLRGKGILPSAEEEAAADLSDSPLLQSGKKFVEWGVAGATGAPIFRKVGQGITGGLNMLRGKNVPQRVQPPRTKTDIAREGVVNVGAPAVGGAMYGYGEGVDSDALRYGGMLFPVLGGLAAQTGMRGTDQVAAKRLAERGYNPDPASGRASGLSAFPDKSEGARALATAQRTIEGQDAISRAVQKGVDQVVSAATPGTTSTAALSGKFGQQAKQGIRANIQNTGAMGELGNRLSNLYQSARSRASAQYDKVDQLLSQPGVAAQPFNTNPLMSKLDDIESMMTGQQIDPRVLPSSLRGWLAETKVPGTPTTVAPDGTIIFGTPPTVVASGSKPANLLSMAGQEQFSMQNLRNVLAGKDLTAAQINQMIKSLNNEIETATGVTRVIAIKAKEGLLDTLAQDATIAAASKDARDAWRNMSNTFVGTRGKDGKFYESPLSRVVNNPDPSSVTSGKFGSTVLNEGFGSAMRKAVDAYDPNNAGLYGRTLENAVVDYAGRKGSKVVAGSTTEQVTGVASGAKVASKKAQDVLRGYGDVATTQATQQQLQRTVDETGKLLTTAKLADDPMAAVSSAFGGKNTDEIANMLKTLPPNSPERLEAEAAVLRVMMDKMGRVNPNTGQQSLNIPEAVNFLQTNPLAQALGNQTHQRLLTFATNALEDATIAGRQLSETPSRSAQQLAGVAGGVTMAAGAPPGAAMAMRFGAPYIEGRINRVMTRDPVTRSMAEQIEDPMKFMMTRSDVGASVPLARNPITAISAASADESVDRAADRVLVPYKKELSEEKRELEAAPFEIDLGEDAPKDEKKPEKEPEFIIDLGDEKPKKLKHGGKVSHRRYA